MNSIDSPDLSRSGLGKLTIDTSPKKIRLITSENQPEPFHWAEYKIKDNKISRRCYHSAVVYDSWYNIRMKILRSRLYIYGGYEINQGILQSFSRIHIPEGHPNNKEFDWEDIKPKSSFTPGK